MEDEWVESVATLVYYAKNNESLQFDLLDPLNEPDWDGFEGPKVDAGQYTRLLEKLSRRLDAMGLGTIHFISPIRQTPTSASTPIYPSSLPTPSSWASWIISVCTITQVRQPAPTLASKDRPSRKKISG